ncbi:MAG: hypothetical protein WDO19_14105 [Bacteroidota bacterium]
MKKQSKSAGKEKDKKYPLPEYPEKDDIYNKDKEELLKKMKSPVRFLPKE